MSPKDRGRPEARTRTYRGSLPLWLLVLVAPLALVFVLASLTVAFVLAGAAALVLPLLWKRAARTRDPDLIELDPSDYHIVERSDRR